MSAINYRGRVTELDAMKLIIMSHLSTSGHFKLSESYKATKLGPNKVKVQLRVG